ncbi:hypothetical protein AURDEDRAFT_155243 [Auricularia subglabra TFB-10046 SS5]|nr:hypothetical protein AURDEDRAFT_155243 [Auricularia subglabra TFB-10046 SS5]
MSALDSAKKRANTNFDSVKVPSDALLALAVHSINKANAAIDQDDADDASVYARSRSQRRQEVNGDRAPQARLD